MLAFNQPCHVKSCVMRLYNYIYVMICAGAMKSYVCFGVKSD